MKTKKNLWKTNTRLPILILFILATGLTNCSKDDDPAPIKELAKSSDKEIHSFQFSVQDVKGTTVTITGTIDATAKTIMAYLPSDTDLTAIAPNIEISDKASVSPAGAQDFTSPVTYTVTAEDDSKVVYTVTLTALSQRQILQAILDANPENIISWDLNATVLGTLNGVTTDIKGYIIELSLGGTNLIQLPPEIGLLTLLTNLQLANNQFTSLPPEIGQLTVLTNLDLYGSNIDSIPLEIGQLTKLTELGLRGNNLSSLPPEIGQLTSLTDLDLSANQFTSMPPEIEQLTNLTTLNIRENQLTSIPVEIGNLTDLINLSFKFNQLTSIPPDIGQLTNLINLHLQGNQLISIPPEIGFLTDLQVLSITENSLTTIPQAVCYLEEFNDLTLSRDAGVLCKTTSEKDALISIYSSNPDNTLAWSVDSFPEVGFNDSGSPTVITMNNKNLTRLPGNIDQLTALKTLHVSQNPFGSIPSSLGNIGTLNVLTLHKTNLSTVPSELGQLTNLALLTLTDNPLTSIPKSVCDLQTSKGGILTILTDSGEGCD